MMTNHKNLASLKVQDIDHLLVVEPSWVYASASVDEVMQKMLADLRTRWIYVIDAQRQLLGGVPMNALVEFLFPLEALIEHPEPLYDGYSPKAGAKTARDLMLAPIPSVTGETTLKDMAGLLINRQVNEVPVVDDANILVGEVNVCEVIKAYLNQSEDQGY